MKAKQEHKKLFQELDKWSQQKDSFSVNDFLKEKGIPLDEFELMANSSKKFMKMWGKAESQSWENVLNALFTNSLPRAKIAEYIRESDDFQGQDPEKIMQILEEGQSKFELYLTAIGDTDTLRKYGRIGNKINEEDALMLCSLKLGMINEDQYREFVAIKKEYKDEEEKNAEDHVDRFSEAWL